MLLAEMEVIQLDVDKTMCMHCGACVGTCPQNAMFLHETRLEFLENCNECGICIRACPVGAIDKVLVNE